MGILSDGAFGLLLGVVYLMTGRNLWVTIIANGLLNSLRFVLVFIGVDWLPICPSPCPHLTS